MSDAPMRGQGPPDPTLPENSGRCDDHDHVLPCALCSIDRLIAIGLGLGFTRDELARRAVRAVKGLLARLEAA